jgi:hypothetical protein
VQLGHDTTEHTEVRMSFALCEQDVQDGEERAIGAAAVASIRPDTLRRVGDGRA